MTKNLFSLLPQKEFKLKSEIEEGFFVAWDCETTHWMIEPEFFLSLIEQVLK
ncbi:hypothetical protein Scep_020494 [Stephania cephalantha]|uniref:Uncharacterized protein n=1 Tax=Stephania cephalantha TaxID=152367 RepID=A0AAP0NPC0_9MAGN